MANARDEILVMLLTAILNLLILHSIMSKVIYE